MDTRVEPLRDGVYEPVMDAAATPISLREMLAVTFSHRRKVVAGFLLPLVLAVAALLILPPKYRAQSDLMVKTGREYMAQTEGDTGLTAPTTTKQEGINSEITLLTSRAVVEQAIRAIGLDVLYPGLVENPPWFETAMDAAVEKFSKELTAEPVKLSNVVAVSFDAGSPAKAKMVLDRLIGIYIDKHTEVFAAGRSDSYADALARATADAERLEQLRTRIRIDSGIYDIAAQRAALISQRVAAEAHLQDVVNTQSMLRGRLGYLRGELPRTPATVRSTGTDRNEAVDHARQTLVDLRAAEAAMTARYAPGNPDLLRVRSQIAATAAGAAGGDRVNVTTAPSPLMQQMRSEIVMGEAQLAPLQTEQARYESLLMQLGGELQRLEASDGELRITTARIEAQNDYLKLVRSRLEAARTQETMDAAHQVSVVQVAPAIAADSVAKPKKLLFLAGGLLLGLLGAGAVVVIAVLTGNTVMTEDGLERLLGLPVLLALPQAPKRPAAPVTLPLR